MEHTPARSPLRVVSFAFLAVTASCSEPRGNGAESDGGPLTPDGAPLTPDASVLDTPDAALPDNCDEEGTPVPEPEVADGFDNDCDGLVDEATACATGVADFTTIAAAIEAAPAGGAVEVCPGTYRERLLIADKPLHVRGTGGAAVTIIDAEQDGRGLGVVDTGDGEVIFEGFTIRRGYVSGGLEGGGVRCSASTLTLRDSVVANSAAEGGMGGGLYATGCTLVVEGTRFEANRGSDGGGAFLLDSSGEVRESQFIANDASDGGGLAIAGGTVSVRDNEVRGNFAAVSGGGLHIESDSLIEGNMILENEADWTGGGIFVSENGPTIRGNVIGGNSSFNDGGGLYSFVSDIVVEDNTIVGNISDDDGGGVRIYSEVAAGAVLGPLHCRVEGNTIEGNTAADSGGGVRISHEPCELLDNTVRVNVAGNRGGGMDLDNDASIVRGGVIEGNRAGSVGGGIAAGLYPWLGGTIEDVTFKDNEADSGGALFIDDNFQDVSLQRLTFEGNQAARGAAIYTTASDVTLRNSLIVGNVATVGGGALFVASSPPYTDPVVCCPPLEPVVDVDFTVMFANQAPAGAAIYLEVAGLAVESSILAANVGPGVEVTGDAVAAPPTWRYNATIPASFVGMPDPTGTDGNLSADPMFVDPAAGDFHLQAASPAKDAGDPAILDDDGTRADMGRYGGPMAP